jgi:plastocyanin
MSRGRTLIVTAIIAALGGPQLEAATIFWKGGSNTFTAVNYVTNPATVDVAPQPGDVVNFGQNGTATHAVAGSTSVGRLRIGHNQAINNGVGTITVNSGNLAVTNNVIGTPALMVGQQRNGTLNINGPGSVTVTRLMVIGTGTDMTRLGTVNVNSGGTLTVSLGNLELGESSGTLTQGVPGKLNVTGNVTLADSSGDLNIGIAGATGTYTQTDGVLSVGDIIEIGTNVSTNTNSSFSISGGTATTGGNIIVGRGASVGATVSISGNAVVNVGNRFLLGGTANTSAGNLPAGSFATGVVTNHTGGILNTVLNLVVADAFPSATSDATYNLSGNGEINATTGGIVGRQGIGKFFQSGGTANFNSTLAIGNRQGAPLATDGLYKISAGDLNVQTALNIASSGTGELRVVGDDATIDVTGTFTVSSTGSGTGTLAYELAAGDSLSMINVTGTATFNAGTIVRIDDTNASFSQFHYDVLTASNIVDNGINFIAPAGWWYKIIDGGNGQILRINVPEPSVAALISLALCLIAGRRRK